MEPVAFGDILGSVDFDNLLLFNLILWAKTFEVSLSSENDAGQMVDEEVVKASGKECRKYSSD